MFVDEKLLNVCWLSKLISFLIIILACYGKDIGFVALLINNIFNVVQRAQNLVKIRDRRKSTNSNFIRVQILIF